MLYTKLQEQQEFRLVRIKPRKFDQVSSNNETIVYCSLEHSIRGDTPYIALSYTWGDQNDRCLINLNGESVSIGRNLEEALRELRTENEDVLIWVDQLSINQDDEEEKSYEVQQMKDIFVKATRVIAWLGPAADDSGLLIETLKRTARDAATGDYHRIFQDFELDLTHYSISHAFRRFCQRGYWSRLWIMQEFAVAQELLITCGNMAISYDDLLQAVSVIEESDSRFTERGDEQFQKEFARLASTYICPEFSFMQGVVSRRQRCQVESLKRYNYFFRVLTTSLVLEVDYNHPQCTNPRDRIFSILGLANDAAAFTKIIDYSRSCEDVYEAIARKILDQDNVDILAFCQFPKASKMATWAPDWRQPTREPCTSRPWVSHFCASRRSTEKQHITYPDIRTIALRGTLVDVVSAIGSAWDPDWLANLPTEQTKQYLDEIHTFCKQSSRISDPDAEVITSIVAIADGMSCRDTEAQERSVECYRQLQVLLSTPEQQVDLSLGTSDPVSRFARYVRSLHSRKPFVSQTGFVGLAPMHVLPGDVICIFPGGRTPYMLRRQDDGVYELVGETFVHGIMYGEFMDENPAFEAISLR